MNSTTSFDQVHATYLHPARNSSSSRGEHELVVFLEKYYSLFLLIFGTVGNLLCLAVLSRETFRRSSAGIYLRFLTVSDLAAIYTGVLFFTARALFSNNLRKTNELSCKFHRWLSFTACDLSSWALVLVSTARLLSIAWPMKRLITRRRVYASILVTIIVLLGANLPIFIIYGNVQDPVRNKTSLCVFTQDSYQDFYIYVFSWLVLVKFGFLPGVLLIVLNAALVLSVSRSGRAVEQPLSHKPHPVTSSGPAARDPKTNMSIRKRKLETEYSSNNTPDFENSEVSTGSEFSDRTLSTSDESEISVTDKANSRLSVAWNKMMGRLKLTNSHRIQDYRIQESSLRKLFRSIQMLWQRDELESQKDLVSLDGDVSNSSLRQDSTVEEKRPNIASTETHLSWLDEGEKSDTENVDDLTRTKTPGQEHVLTENTNQLKQETGASLKDASVRNVSTTNRENRLTDHDKDIDVNINEISSNGACVEVEHRSSDNCVHVNHTQGHTPPTCPDHHVCAYSMSETPPIPRGTAGGKGNTPASCSCGSCPGTATAGSCPGTATGGSCLGTAAGFAKDTASTISSGLGERTNSDPASTCASQNDATPHAEPHNAVTQVDHLTEQPAVSQKDTMNAEPGDSVTQVDHLTEQPAVSQKGTMNSEPGDSVTQVDQKTELPTVSGRHGCRRKSGLPRKVANKSRSLTRTLLVLNTVFLLCNTPITVYLTGKAYFWPDAVEYSDVQEIIVTVANFSMYTSNSINFILYCVTGSRFRGQLVLMFKELYHFVCSCARRLSRVNKQRI